MKGLGQEFFALIETDIFKGWGGRSKLIDRPLEKLAEVETNCPPPPGWARLGESKLVEGRF